MKKRMWFFLAVFSISLPSFAQVPVLTEELLSQEWCLGEVPPSWAILKFQQGEFFTDIPNSGEFCQGTYTLENQTLVMTIKAQNLKFLLKGARQGQVEVVIKDVLSVFHPYALVDKATGEILLWPSGIKTPSGKKNRLYQGIALEAIHRNGTITEDGVYLRSGPSTTKAPYFFQLMEPFESDDPRPPVTSKFLAQGQLLDVIGRTQGPVQVGSTKNHWYLVKPNFQGKGSPYQGMVFTTSLSETGPFYTGGAVWIYGEFLNLW